MYLPASKRPFGFLASLPMKVPQQPRITAIVQTIEAQGAQFTGLQDAPRGCLVLFMDAITRTTLALPECEVSPEAVARRLRTAETSTPSPSKIPPPSARSPVGSL